MSTILLVHTSGIHCFHNLADKLVEDGMQTSECWNKEELKLALDAEPYNAVLISLEPDGFGGIQGIEELELVGKAAKQQDAVCFGISVSSTRTLQSAKEEYKPALAVVAAWLDLPVKAEKSSKIIHDVIASAGKLTIANRAKAHKN